MKIESLRLKNFKAFRSVEIRNLPQFCVFVGHNGAGKSAIFSLIDHWHISDFHIQRARPEREAGYAEHLSREGENLSLVVEYLYRQHPEVFDRILRQLARRVPGITRVESKTTEEGRVLLKFQDGAFEDPFLARYGSGFATRHCSAFSPRSSHISGELTHD